MEDPSADPGLLSGAPVPGLCGNHHQVLQETVRGILLRVCQMILPHQEQLLIQGTIGVTVDSSQVLLVHLAETLFKEPDRHSTEIRVKDCSSPASLRYSPVGTDTRNLSHSLALEEDICTRGVVIDREDEEAELLAQAKPVVIEPQEDGNDPPPLAPLLATQHRKKRHLKMEPTVDEPRPETWSPLPSRRKRKLLDSTKAYSQKNYTQIPARLRHNSSTSGNALKSLLLGSSSNGREPGDCDPKRLHSTQSPDRPKSRKREGLLLGMLLSKPQGAAAKGEQPRHVPSPSRALDLTTAKGSSSSSSRASSSDGSRERGVREGSALRELLCHDKHPSEVIDLSASTGYDEMSAEAPSEAESCMEDRWSASHQLRDMLKRKQQDEAQGSSSQ